MTRWIRVQVSIFDHDLFADEPFTEREAWLWMISKAAWKETRHRAGSAMVTVPIGSFFVTLRELQDTWKWGSDFRVRTFLKLLKSQEMITLDANAGKTRISICNYSHYQNVHHEENASETQPKRKENALKTPVHQYTSSSSLRSEEAPVPKMPTGFDQFWAIYPNRVGKRDAEKSFVKAVKRADLQIILDGLSRYVAKTDDRPWCNPATWLNQDRWEDAPAAVPQRSVSPPQGRRMNAVEAYLSLKSEQSHEPASRTIDHRDVERVPADEPGLQALLGDLGAAMQRPFGSSNH